MFIVPGERIRRRTHESKIGVVFICSLGGEALVVLFLNSLALFALFHRLVLLSEVSK
ncbi:hypothetical protein HBI56_100200 [Parastagonospora nodorum]|uniref:Uncharacterized protein n=1 Tax=Phaeosphaeria nodorum (strain SN15 / ATCC MYA-4574 / FGSC 10173) TaxID=321614 RepID=A0A7U2F5L3_PHANO|nr:hypothetical protein HBH56_029130 [Parastagonospora nodorum]QRC99167.1 hypothetical protein JI435_413080 [Parastagonospora nodorum SN15]KAH3934165.1 hypothetical protein HBH54_052900 [Parastagonospora nodorum]KAH3943101.1 hypothetical protein HBH53_177810 [Parastagonospora nodorum]KAH3959204.1 hypothetical protein HBH51_200170 [Parastagonospora nodorum]